MPPPFELRDVGGVKTTGVGLAVACALTVASALIQEAQAVTRTGGTDPSAMTGEGGPAPTRPTRAGAWTARVVVPAAARSAPGSGRIVARLTTTARWNGGPVVLLVLDSRASPDGTAWLQVRLPTRPNGTAGWIRADFVRLRRTPYRIEISTRRRTVSLLRNGRVLHRFRAVVGRRTHPTPHGLFAVSERVAQPDPRAFIGPWALHLTAYSNTLVEFGGGPGTVALHGRGPASLDDPLGSARSHGCIRIDSSAIRVIARLAREGTPVAIQP